MAAYNPLPHPNEPIVPKEVSRTLFLNAIWYQ